MLTLKKVAENHGLTKDGVDFALSQYQIVISEITHGMMSKLSYYAKDILQVAQDRWCDTCELKQPDEPDRVKVVRCMDCIFWEPENAEEGDSYGHCRNYYAPCQNQQTDINWFCADGEGDG